MSHGVHASVNGMKLRPVHPSLDPPHRHAKRHQLVAGNHAVLTPRQLGERRIYGVLDGLTTHTVVKSASSRIHPLSAGGSAERGA
jgi:hypothetical protein